LSLQKTEERSGKKGVGSTAFWRENFPGKLPLSRAYVEFLERVLKVKIRKISEIYLFPFSKECIKTKNFISCP